MYGIEGIAGTRTEEKDSDEHGWRRKDDRDGKR